MHREHIPERPQFIYMYQSHLDLFWLGNYHMCLERGNVIIKQYIDRCRERPDETFLIETVVFLQHFLKSYPDYKEIVKELWAAGRIDIGCAYVDVWQNLVLGETHIRNVAEGKGWLKRELGLEVTQAVHPDLPGLTPQTAQIYAKAGVETYMTVRKVFGDGQVWVYESPDGSGLLILTQPVHYDFRPFDDDDQILFDRTWGIMNAERTLKGFPLNKVLLSAGCGDLTSMETFEERIGRPAREIIDDYAQRYPQFEFRFGSFRQVLQEYMGIAETLPRLQGEIPSVWGVACDESVAFFQASRRLEGKLLTAGMLEAFGIHHGEAPLAHTREEWYGTFSEQAHYRDWHPIARGEELDELWRMHIFTQDHNGGGQEGALSEFQKRTIQDRAISYADRIIAHHMKGIGERMSGPADLLLFNPLNRRRCEPFVVELPRLWLEQGLSFKSADGTVVPWQIAVAVQPSEEQVPVVLAAAIEGAGYTTVVRALEAETSITASHAAAMEGVSIQESEDAIILETDEVVLTVSKRTGSIVSLLECATGKDWGSQAVNRVYAVRETGNDVTLRVDESTAVGMETVHRVEVAETGPLFVKIRVVKEILKAWVEQDITLWLQGVGRLDIDTVIYWHGERNIQLRQCLPSAYEREAVVYGTPFYASGWMDVAEGSRPKMPDEYKPEDYPNYREVQMWLHQKREDSALAIATSHPGFHWGEDGLEAVLMRTTRSCGDNRFYWENSGRQHYHFRMKFGPANETGWAFDLGQQLLCPVVAMVQPACRSTVEGAERTTADAAAAERAAGVLPLSDTFVGLEEENLLLSSVYPDQIQGQMVIRFFETEGRAVQAHLKLKGLERLERMTLDGRVLEPVERVEDTWQIPVQPYEIVTLKASK